MTDAPLDERTVDTDERVFDPDAHGTSDGEWLELVRQASGGGRYFFTENQLYLQYARGRVMVTRSISRRALLGLGMIAIGLAIWVYALKADWGITLVLGIALTLGGVACVGTGVVTRREPAARDVVTRWLARWRAARPLERFIAAPTLSDSGLEFAPQVINSVVVVERELVVDLLLKNGAQHELSALIIAPSGYPRALATEARRLLLDRPDLRVIAVHDATAAGIALRARLQSDGALPLAGRPLLDAGLFPADVPQLEELAPAIPLAHIDRVPLDSLPYESLLRGLRGMTRGALSLFTAISESD